MLGLLRIASALAVLTFAGPVAAEEPDDDACYDMAVVGRIRHVSNYIDLNDLLGPPEDKPDMIRWGGRADFRIRVEVASAKQSVPGRITVQAITAVLPLRNSTILFFIQKLKDGRYFAVDWEWAHEDRLGRYTTEGENAPPMCTSARRRIGDS